MDITVVCPFYNEAGIIEHALRKLLEQLNALNGTWELIVVNDGSTDSSLDIALRIAQESPPLRVLSYPHNRGRGFALRTGIGQARGDIIVTTEIDLSWGDDIVHNLVKAMREHPETDIVVASPHLSGGGYRNVPPKRVWLSRMGNRVIRACMSNVMTMNTGMTRAYRREVIQTLPLTEDGKEFHLEVILKATSLGYRLREIPAILEWKEYKHKGQRVKRKSSSRVNRLIVSHSLFSVFANPIRYVWAFSFLFFALGSGASLLAVTFLILRMDSAATALLGLLLLVLSMVLFLFGVVLKQGNMIQRELWSLQHSQLEARNPNSTVTSFQATERSRAMVGTS